MQRGLSFCAALRDAAWRRKVVWERMIQSLRFETRSVSQVRYRASGQLARSLLSGNSDASGSQFLAGWGHAALFDS
ncbi:hypothetical protein N7462_009323 [Penicillium macrosclerotiorum]|uniref:uncharacterized protein n=1 Tax=Penicillium macrosclerotiorum TaxID=303699 RepID=UPI002548981D|nr:uncharacterized protein N7462_009323 [Penicillium macrosclerotiorum]KAJ5673884.1 hypothetical protein N7462_009323 [Penicillium macrosclerotiorum]